LKTLFPRQEIERSYFISVIPQGEDNEQFLGKYYSDFFPHIIKLFSEKDGFRKIW